MFDYRPTVLECLAVIQDAAEYWQDTPQGESTAPTIARVVKAVEAAQAFLQVA